MKRLRLYLVSGLFLAFLFWPAPVGAAPPDRGQSQDQIVHVVQRGQNLFRIALQYGTSVDAIVAANGLTSSHTVYAGQRLIIPRGSGGSATTGGAAATGGTYVVRWGDTLSRIAVRYGVTVRSLVAANGLSSTNVIYAGQRLIIPGAGGNTAASAPASGTQEAPPASGTYVVRPGDTLTKIAQRFGTTANALARLNGIANPSAIYTGQVLRLSGATPVSASGSAAGVAAPGGAKRILMDLSEQHLYAYEGSRLIYSFVASSGAAPSYTRTGEFRVQSKVPKAYGSAWNIWMPHWLGIYWAGSTENGIHALPILPGGQTLWAGYLGRPVSYGCIVLGTYEAQLLYNWAELGTPVSIRY
jgi:LysM repeat protein